MRLLAADYCGIGAPFTHDGVQVRLAMPTAGNHVPTDASGYGMPNDGGTPEAVWTDQGATCIATPRVVPDLAVQWTLDTINDKCKELCQDCNKPGCAKFCNNSPVNVIPACDPPPLSGGYVSASP